MDFKYKKNIMFAAAPKNCDMYKPR